MINKYELEGYKFEKDQIGVWAEMGEKNFKSFAKERFWNEPYFAENQSKNIDELWLEVQNHGKKVVVEEKPKK